MQAPAVAAGVQVVVGKVQFGFGLVLDRAPAIASPACVAAGVVRLAESDGAVIAMTNVEDAADRSPDVSATFRVNPDSEQAAVGVPETVPPEVEKVRPWHKAKVVPNVDEISVPLL